MLPSTQKFHQKLFVIYDFINKAKGNCTCTRQEASNSHLVSAHELLFNQENRADFVATTGRVEHYTSMFK